MIAAEAYKMIVKDDDGVVWVYEGRVDGNRVFVKEAEAIPKMMTFGEALVEYESYLPRSATELVNVMEG